MFHVATEAVSAGAAASALGGTGERLYGVCVFHPRLARAGGFASGASERLFVVPRCYCLLTRFPFFELALRALWLLLRCLAALFEAAEDVKKSASR